MLISHKYKLIFIHIYKNAGTFVRQLLYNLDTNVINAGSHTKAKEAKNQIPADIWNNYTKICVVRNSWDWQMSLYFYTKGLHTHHQHNIVKDMNVSEYIEWRKTDLKQQIEFILDNNGDCLVDHIFQFENLNSNIIHFFKEKYNLDVKPYLPLTKLNSSNRNSDYKIYYNERDKNLLAEMHEPDIKYFNFKF